VDADPGAALDPGSGFAPAGKVGATEGSGKARRLL